MQTAVYHRDEIAGNTDTGFLKLVALVCMLCDHIGVVFFRNVIEWRVIGRIALPLYAWCLTVGSVKTHCSLKYALRLLILAVCSQPLYMAAIGHTWKELNILFMLFLGAVGIAAIRKRFFYSQIWTPILCYAVLEGLSFCGIKIDYGWKGLTFLFLLYLSRSSKGSLFAVVLAYSLFWGIQTSAVTSLFGLKLPFSNWKMFGPELSQMFRLQGMIWLSLPFLLISTKTRIRYPKWLGYAFYPLHLLLLIILRVLSGTAFSALLTVF